MQIIYCNTAAELDDKASDMLIHDLQQKPDSMICAATGNSPTGMYQKLVERKNEFQTDKLRIVKLDEWHGLGIDDAGSCEQYLHQYVLNPLNIAPAQYIAFDGKTSNPDSECQRISQYLDENGPADICILGIGKNGHIAFNEPAAHLQPRAHLAVLSETSLQHSMVTGTGARVKHGFTLGVADIMQSKKIILLVNGTAKKPIMQQLFERQISTQLPASLLWLHQNAVCFYCESDN